MTRALSFFILLGALVATFVVAPAELYADDRDAVETLSIMGRAESLPTRPGSSHIITEEDFEDFQINDIHRILRQVPGVNLQEEDGFGLRPNIGLRGVRPQRSKKITLMEDGVLIAPAPYAAPAAYYFPQLDKMSGIEVFKGTPSVAFGPNSVGGAINFVTRANPEGVSASLAAGSYGFQKYDLSTGIDLWGDLTIDLTRMQSTGFKVLPRGQDTGFVRQNAMIRWDKHFSHMDQDLTVKLNWSDEVSNETYIGLTDSDFARNPYQRYAGTELDRMDWQHKQFFASYAISPVEALRTRITLYRHEQDRNWFKLNGFYNGVSNTPTLDNILSEPTLAANSYFYQVVSGQADSGVLSDSRDVLDLGGNDRSYLSQGVQTQWDYDSMIGNAEQTTSFFYRYHEDLANRNHVSRFFNMSGGALVENSTIGPQSTKVNESRAKAHTIVLKHNVQWSALETQAIVRYEDISYEEDNFLTAGLSTGSDHIFAPGIGFFYQMSPHSGWLLGVHKGFTPVGPGQGPGIRPEEAINSEFGFRHMGWIGLELIGFYSDYENILGTCTLASGCDPNNLDNRFNGGQAKVYGAEFMVNKDLEFSWGKIPLRFNATYTQARFDNSFVSNNPDWGLGTVQVGDPLPYLPDWQGLLSLGYITGAFSGFISANYQSELPDQAVAVNRRVIAGRTVFDLTLAYRFAENSRVTFRADNVFDRDYAVSYQPEGLRPGRPQTFIIGVDLGLL